MFVAAGPHCSFSFSLCCALKPNWSHFTLFYFLPFEMYVLNCFTEAFSMCRPLYWNECPNLYGVRGLRLCPSQWRGGLVYKGMDKGSFDDVTSFILRRHQINLCLSLLKIYGPSSSSSTSSSPSASSQRKSAFQQPTNGVGWYVNQVLREMAFLLEHYS